MSQLLILNDVELAQVFAYATFSFNVGRYPPYQYGGFSKYGNLFDGPSLSKT